MNAIYIFRIDLTSDGRILAVGQSTYDNDKGAIHTFMWENGEWVKFGNLIVGIESGGRFGFAVSLTRDG